MLWALPEAASPEEKDIGRATIPNDQPCNRAYCPKMSSECGLGERASIPANPLYRPFWVDPLELERKLLIKLSKSRGVTENLISGEP